MPVLKKFLIILSLSLMSGAFFKPLSAAEEEPLLDRNLFSIGVGFSDNSMSSPSEDDTGFQFLGAYDLSEVNLMEGVASSIEFGFMDFGFPRDDTGIWASYLVDSTISGQFGWLAQVGFDIGDDSGLLFGAGVKYAIDEKMDLRGEYVIRDEVDSLQFNLLYHL